MDWFLPPQARQLSQLQRWRLRMAVGTSLLISGLLSFALVALPVPTGDARAPALFTAVVLTASALAPRLLGAVRIPGLVLGLYPVIATTVLSLREPDVVQYAIVLPLLAGFFGGRYLALATTVVGTAELLFVHGPLSTALSPHELELRMNFVFETLLVGGIAYLSDRFLIDADRERTAARDKAVAMAREQAQQEALRGVHERQLRQQALRVEVGQALAGPESLAESLRRCCAALVHHLEVGLAGVWLLDDAEEALELQARAARPELTGWPPAHLPLGAPGIGRIAKERRPGVVLEPADAADVGELGWARREGLQGFAGYPLTLGERLVGVLAVFAGQPLPEDALEALGASADAIAQAVVRKRAELALAQRADELARSNKELEQFAYAASHDLQEPLRMVSSYTQLLSRRYQGKIDSNADEFIGFIVDGVKRMQGLIRDLLEYSRVTTRRKEPVLVDSTPLLEQVLANLKHAIEESAATVTHDPLPMVPVDDMQFGQLLQNLLSNALKFRREGVPPRIHVSAAREGDSWVFSVQDNGIGIEPQYFERIFVIFQRLHTRADYPGTGIGLALCKRIVETHGGQIRVDSTPGQGTTFRFSLPAELRQKPISGGRL